MIYGFSISSKNTIGETNGYIFGKSILNPNYLFTPLLSDIINFPRI